MEVEVKIREDNEELEKNLKKVVLIIDGNSFSARGIQTFQRQCCRYSFKEAGTALRK
jgi:hypothetical protein